MNIFQIFVDNDVLLFLGFEAGEMYPAFVVLLCKKKMIFLIYCWSVERFIDRHVYFCNIT
jgi:hypothetical protein